MAYNPLNWYWFVDGDTSTVWSSAMMRYLPVTDPGYQAWTANGQQSATPVGSFTDLTQIIFEQWVPIVQRQGIPVICLADGTISGTYAIDKASTDNITAIATGLAAGRPPPSGNDTFIYRDIADNPHIFTAPQFVTFAGTIENYVYLFTEALRVLLSGGTANPPSLPIEF